MLCKIVKQFTFCEDGINHLDAPKDHNVEIPDHMVEGLYSEGYVAEPDKGAVAGPIDASDSDASDQGDTVEDGINHSDDADGNSESSDGGVGSEAEPFEGTGTEELENKALEVDETKADEADEVPNTELEELRATYKDAAGSDADKRWSVETLREKLIEL